MRDEPAHLRAQVAQSPPRVPPRNCSQARATLQRDGVVHLPGALPPDALAQVDGAVAFSLANPSPAAKHFYPKDLGDLF